MKTHYIPRLLLRKFATNDKVNSYYFAEEGFRLQKLKTAFAGEDLFEEYLEKAFATKLEGPFGDLLNHKLLGSDTIKLNREENMLIRMFLMINSLRAPILNNTWEDMIEKTQLKEHPTVQARDFLIRHSPIWEKVFEENTFSNQTYLQDLKKAMEIFSLEELADYGEKKEISNNFHRIL